MGAAFLEESSVHPGAKKARRTRELAHSKTEEMKEMLRKHSRGSMRSRPTWSA